MNQKHRELTLSMKKRLIIQANNVHRGGGRTLLVSILNSFRDDTSVIALLDSRMVVDFNIPSNITIKRIKPSVLSRLNSEYWVKKNTTQDDVVLCFGNLPPLFKLKGKTFVFLQNKYLTGRGNISDLSFKTKLRILLERIWLKQKAGNVNDFIVQTPTMKDALSNANSSKTTIHILPFLDNTTKYKRSLLSPQTTYNTANTFTYIASGEPHKNHTNLLKAWQLLGKEGIFLELNLTIFQKPLIKSDPVQKIDNLKINFLGPLPYSEVLLLYKKSDAVIYPSFFESFGIPLIEARKNNLPIIASELDYVRDIVDPEEVFDPKSPTSIARAVKRFLNKSNYQLSLVDAKHFIDFLFKN